MTVDDEDQLIQFENHPLLQIQKWHRYNNIEALLSQGKVLVTYTIMFETFVIYFINMQLRNSYWYCEIFHDVVQLGYFNLLKYGGVKNNSFSIYFVVQWY